MPSFKEGWKSQYLNLRLWLHKLKHLWRSWYSESLNVIQPLTAVQLDFHLYPSVMPCKTSLPLHHLFPGKDLQFGPIQNSVLGKKKIPGDLQDDCFILRLPALISIKLQLRWNICIFLSWEAVHVTKAGCAWIIWIETPKAFGYQLNWQLECSNSKVI